MIKVSLAGQEVFKGSQGVSDQKASLSEFFLPKTPLYRGESQGFSLDRSLSAPQSLSPVTGGWNQIGSQPSWLL